METRTRAARDRPIVARWARNGPPDLRHEAPMTSLSFHAGGPLQLVVAVHAALLAARRDRSSQHGRVDCGK